MMRLTHLQPGASRAPPPQAQQRPQRQRQHVQQPQQQQHHQQLQQQKQQPQQEPLAGAASGASGRRRVVLAAGAAALLVSRPRPAAATAAPARAACEQPLQTAPNGLQWCDLEVGDGNVAIKGAFTKLHYEGRLSSTGGVFDSSYSRRTPLIFKVGEHEAIEAFDVGVLGAEGIPPMHEGGRRRIVAPPGPLQRQGVKSLTWVVGLSEALADAGELSDDGTPTSALEFDIELLKKRQR